MKTPPTTVTKHNVSGYLAAAVEFLNTARAGWRVAVSVGGAERVNLIHSRGKYGVNGRALGRTDARKAILAALADAADVTYVVSW